MKKSVLGVKMGFALGLALLLVFSLGVVSCQIAKVNLNQVKSEVFAVDPRDVVLGWDALSIQVYGPVQMPDGAGGEKTFLMCVGVFSNPDQEGEAKTVTAFFDCNENDVYSVGWEENGVRWIFVRKAYNGAWEQVSPDP